MTARFSRFGWRTALAGAGLALTISSCAATPRNDRVWYPYLSHTAHVDLSADRFAVRPVSDWRYAPNDTVSQNYGDAGYDFADLRNIWFVLEPQPGSNLAAHTFLLFEFSNDRLLGVTIEARRETGEDYSAFRGAFNAYELAYLWGSARDLLTRRAVMLDHEVFVYPTQVDETQKRALLRHLLERTAALETHPRFYNTLTSNCTNELAKATDLNWHYSFILTGASDNYLFRRGLIPGASFDQAHRRSDMTAFVKTLNGSDTNADFDLAMLRELRARNSAS